MKFNFPTYFTKISALFGVFVRNFFSNKVLLFLLILELGLQLFSFVIFKIYIDHEMPRIGTYAPYVMYIDQKPIVKAPQQIADAHIRQIWLLGDVSSSKEHMDPAQDIFSTYKDYFIVDLRQRGYIINQARIYFLELLRNNPRPEMVFFFSGISEKQAAYIGYPIAADRMFDIYYGKVTWFTFCRELCAGNIKMLVLLDQLCNMTLPAMRHILKYNPFRIMANDGSISARREMALNYQYNKELIEIICTRYGIQYSFVTD
jgi:hypothetical protein